jgi:hypothetical protein
MKYSIRGDIPAINAETVIDVLNDYTLWRLDTGENEGVFSFEAWVNAEGYKTDLFDDLKPLIDSWGGWINWHICSHDEAEPQPCVIVETYPVQEG